MFRASILLLIFTAIFQFLLHRYAHWLNEFSILLSLTIALAFIIVTNFIWRINIDAILEVFRREVTDNDN